MESYLDKIIEYIHHHPVKLTTRITQGGDGRIDSTINEDEVINHLQNVPQFKKIIITPPPRSFYDFAISDNGKTIYINIKVSDFSNNSADNCSSKEGLAYALTGLTTFPIGFVKFHELLVRKLRKGYDYYFLVINKNDHSDAYWTSLKRICTLVPNGNNLPFQCNWASNRSFSGRSEEEATRYLLKTYLTSWEKKVNGFPFDIKRKLEDNTDIFDNAA